MRKRVVVTGLGAITPLGNNVPALWEGLLAGRSGVGYLSGSIPPDLGVRFAAEVKDFDTVALFGRRDARRNDRFTFFALEAAREAVADAKIEFDALDSRRVGVAIGSGVGGLRALLDGYDVMLRSGCRRVSPLLAPMMMINAATAAVTIAYGIHGPSVAPVSACATGTHAIGEAAELIRRGRVDLILCGGSEAAIAPVSLAGFMNMGALSTRDGEPEQASRPFDAQRDGFVMGEGAGVLVLESLEHARQRGARILGELIGYGMSTDAFHITAPDEGGQGAISSMQDALDDAGIAPEEVDYINAHGTSTPLNDRIETLAIRAVFPHADRLPVNSTKSMIGHLIGAAGAVEAIVCVKSLETGWVHQTINYEYPDPECDLDYVVESARRLAPRVALSNSFGFGGHNASLILRRWEETS